MGIDVQFNSNTFIHRSDVIIVIWSTFDYSYLFLMTDRIFFRWKSNNYNYSLHNHDFYINWFWTRTRDLFFINCCSKAVTSGAISIINRSIVKFITSKIYDAIFLRRHGQKINRKSEQVIWTIQKGRKRDNPLRPMIVLQHSSQARPISTLLCDLKITSLS